MVCRENRNKVIPTLCEKVLVVHYAKPIRPTEADNSLTLDRVVLVASIMAGYASNFAWYIHDKIHERAFREVMSIHFPALFRSSVM